ncbi:MAG TPA: alpha/beta hydrolase, partial [Mycobacterium sp.]
PTLEPSKRQPNLCYAGVPVKANRSAHGIAAACTLRSWLGMWSLRHAQTRADPHLARIDCPALVINAEQDTGVYPSDAQRIYDALGSRDNSQCAIEKADTIAQWIAKRWR